MPFSSNGKQKNSFTKQKELALELDRRMVQGWRRALCSSIPRDEDEGSKKSKREPSNTNLSPRLGSRFGFFSNPSTPRGQTQPPPTPNLQCRTSAASAPAPEDKSPRLLRNSKPSPPRSPSAFSLLKSGLRLSRVRCGICLHSIRTGQGTAIFTAECSHGFHHPCLATYAAKHVLLACPTCGSIWNDPPVLTTINSNPKPGNVEKKQNQRPGLKVYNDDEPLMSPGLFSRFNPIPEDEEDEFFKFRGPNQNLGLVKKTSSRNVEVMLLPEAAVVSVGHIDETYVAVLKVRAPPVSAKSSLRIPIDLVTVLDVGSGLNADGVQTVKRAMRRVVSSLSSTDRLSIVAFGAVSKRLLPLRRMTANGKLAARRIIDALVSTNGLSSAGDALKKGAKVLEDRHERNPTAAIILISDAPTRSTTTRLDVPIHSLAPDEACASGFNFLNVAVLGLRMELGLVTGSGQAKIAAVYPLSNRFGSYLPGSVRVGDLYAEEEREFLIELTVPLAGSARSHHVLSVRCCHVDQSSQELTYGKEQGLLLPRPHSIRSTSPQSIEWLRCLFFSTRAMAESRRLVERGDVAGANRLLTSTRVLLTRSRSFQAEGFVAGLEAELAELQKWVRVEAKGCQTEPGVGEEKDEQLTPTSAWRAAEKLAKVAIMRKSMNRVSDLHGFEDARF